LYGKKKEVPKRTRQEKVKGTVMNKNQDTSKHPNSSSRRLD